MRGHAHRGYGRDHGRNYEPHVSRGRVRDHACGHASDPACPHKPQRARPHTGGRVSIVYYSSLRSYISVFSVCFTPNFAKILQMYNILFATRLQKRHYLSQLQPCERKMPFIHIDSLRQRKKNSLSDS
jgi:hypothetical protein